MAVIVNDDMPIDQALKMLWREANREGVPEKLRDLRYHTKPSVAGHALRRKHKKTKTRRRRATRRLKQKHG